MDKNIRLVGLDLDGTLLNKQNIVSERNKNTIIACLNQGIVIYLITGRPYCFAKKIAMDIDRRIGVVSANGGLYEIGNHIVETPIDAYALQEVIDVLKNSKMKAFLKGRYEFYTHEPYDERFLYDHFNQEVPHSLQVKSYVDLSWEEMKQMAHDVVKILVYHLDKERLAFARSEIECIRNIEVTDYQSKSFDITAYQVHKGNVIKTILKLLEIDKEQFMAIGDGNNDIVMFQEAGYRVAMQNASDEVKQYCNIISDDCEHDGVAKALEDYILKED